MSVDVTLPQEHRISFGKTPIRVVLANDDVWFAAADLYASQRSLTDKTALSRFDRRHLRIHTFYEEGLPKRLTIVSSIGALSIAKYFRSPKDRIVDAWVRKTMVALDFPRPPLTLGADGTMPVRPREADWDNYDAWQALREANPTIRINPIASGLAELDDDDIPPPKVIPTQEQLDADWQDMLDAQLAWFDVPRRSTPKKRTKR